MDTQDHKQLVIRDSAIIFRVAGGIFAIGSLAFFAAKMMAPGMSFVVAGLSLVVFFSDLTIVADWSTRILKLEYRYLIFPIARKISFDDIDDIQAQRHVSSSNGNYSVGYRIIATLYNGETVPFRLFYSGGVEKKQQAAKLRTFILGRGTRNTSAGSDQSDEYLDPNDVPTDEKTG
jgi:hypothetical protein